MPRTHDARGLHDPGHYADGTSGRTAAGLIVAVWPIVLIGGALLDTGESRIGSGITSPTNRLSGSTALQAQSGSTAEPWPGAGAPSALAPARKG